MAHAATDFFTTVMASIPLISQEKEVEKTSPPEIGGSGLVGPSATGTEMTSSRRGGRTDEGASGLMGGMRSGKPVSDYREIGNIRGISWRIISRESFH